MADINKIIHAENSESQLTKNLANEELIEEVDKTKPVIEANAVTTDQKNNINDKRAENKLIAQSPNAVSVDASKPKIEQNSFVENLKEWYDNKLEQNKKIYAENAEKRKKVDRELAQFVGSKALRGIILGRVESINELINFGGDVLDVILHDQLPDRPADWKAIQYGFDDETDERENEFLVEYPEDLDSPVYNVSKAVSQWVIPTFALTKLTQGIGAGKKGYFLHKQGGLYKKLGLTKKKGDVIAAGVSGAVVDATLTDPYDENLFNWLEDKYDLNGTIIDYLSAPDTDDIELSSRLRSRMVAVAQGYVIGEKIIGEVAPALAKTGEKIVKPTVKAFNGIAADAAAYVKEKGGKTVAEKTANMVDFMIEQFAEIKRNPSRRARVLAKLDSILKNNGGDIGKIENELADDSLMATLETYSKAIDSSPELSKFNKNVPVKEIKGAILRNSKITRTFNPRNLYKNFFEKPVKGKNKRGVGIKDGNLSREIKSGNSLLDYINERGKLVKKLNKNNVTSIQSMYLKASEQIPEKTVAIFRDFNDKYGVGGEVDLQASIIALNDMVSESGIVIKDLSGQLIDIMKMKGQGSLQQEYYQVLKEDFAYSLKMMSDLLNVKNVFKEQIGKTLRVINETSPNKVEGLDEFLRKSNQENLLDEYKIKRDLGIESEISNDPLQSFSVDQLLKMAEEGSSKELEKVVSRLHLAAMNPRAMKEIMAAQQGGNFMKITNELFINSILSSPITHQVNMISTGINTIGKPITKFLGGVAMGDGEVITRSYKDMVYMLSALKESAYMATRSFMANKNIIDSSASTVDISKLAQIDTTNSGNLVKLVHGFYTLPQRFLMAEDEFFKQVNFRSYVRAEIWERASKMTFKDQGAYDNYVGGQFDRVIKTINRESMVGKLSKQNQKLLRDAQLYANQATFTEELMEGTSGKAIQRVVNQNPVLRQIIPFIRTPLNIMKQFNKANPALTYLGGLDTKSLDKYGLGFLTKNADGQLVNKNPLQNFAFIKEHMAELNSLNKSERAIAKGRSIAGGALWAGGTMAAFAINDPEAKIAITGGLPSNKQARENLLATGFMPYSFRTRATEEEILKYGKGEKYKPVQHSKNPDVTYMRGEDGLIKYKYTSYKRLEPYANFLAISADAARIVGHLTTDQQLEKDTIYQVMMSSMYNNIIDKNYLRGITELVEVMRDEASLNAWLMNRASQLAVPMSSLTKNVKTAVNSGAFGLERDGNVRMDKSVGEGAFTNALGDQGIESAPFIMVRRLLNEIANKTPFGNHKARPMQHHITGLLMETPVGFGKDSWNVALDGWSTDTVSNNDLVLSVINETGMAANPPTDRIHAKDNFGIELNLDQQELGDLIYHTAKHTLFYKGKKMRMYDAMETYLRTESAINKIEMMRGNLPLNRKGDVTAKARKYIAQQTGDAEFLTMPFDEKMKTSVILAMRNEVKDELEEIHSRYKKAAKEHYLSCDGGVDNQNFCYSKEKQQVYQQRKRDSSKWTTGFESKEEDSFIEMFN